MPPMPGDRVLITHKEIPGWIPTKATVMKLSIRFPNTPMERKSMHVHLDKNPFPQVLLDPIRDLSFDIDDPNIVVELVIWK